MTLSDIERALDSGRLLMVTPTGAYVKARRRGTTKAHTHGPRVPVSLENEVKRRSALPTSDSASSGSRVAAAEGKGWNMSIRDPEPPMTHAQRRRFRRDLAIVCRSRSAWSRDILPGGRAPTERTDTGDATVTHPNDWLSDQAFYQPEVPKRRHPWLRIALEALALAVLLGVAAFCGMYGR